MFEKGHLSEEEVAIYADAIITGKLTEIPSELKNHVQTCDECAEKVLAVTEITEDVLKNKKKTTNNTIPLKKSYWIQIAASIILIIGAGIFIYQKTQKNNNSIQLYSELIDSAIIQVDSSTIRKSDIKKLTAQNEKDSNISIEQKKENNSINKNLLAYTEDANLEKLVERFTESALRGDFSVDIESTVEIKLNEELVFNLNNKHEKTLILEFFNHSGKKIFEEETTKNTFQTNLLTTPGLYYWKLLNEDFDLLFCGKIIVR